MNLADVGWIWEGQGIDPGVEPSIFGAGEGAAYFGLRRACFMFHPNSELAMHKMAGLAEIVCDISKWKYRWPETGGVAHWVDAKPDSVRAEAQHVSRLSRRFPNITGGIHDDMRGLIRRENWTPADYSQIYAALKSANPALKLWCVVYTHELDDDWKPFLPFIDIANLWVWKAADLPTLDAGLDRCRQVFPEKPIILGCYLRDYPTAAPVPMERLKYQWQRIPRYLEQGKITGYSILGTVLIDGQQQQANWVRDFIAEHSATPRK